MKLYRLGGAVCLHSLSPDVLLTQRTGVAITDRVRVEIFILASHWSEAAPE